MPDKQIKVLELFAGKRSVGTAFEAKGHIVFSVDWDSDFPFWLKWKLIFSGRR